MISHIIPNSIEVKIYKQKNGSYLIKVSNDLTWTWFTTNDSDVNLEGRIIFGNKKTIKSIKRGIKALLLGYKRSLSLKGVGFKASLSEDGKFLLIKVSNTKPSTFKLPSDISINIDNNVVNYWSYNVNIIDHFFKKVILETPAPKNYIIWK